jgi:tetratricopeptide (TPR) repeat protein
MHLPHEFTRKITMMVRRWFLVIAFVALLPGLRSADVKDDPLVREALAAEARLDTRGALELFLAADRARPNDAFILQKIARQYSDLSVDLTDRDAQRRTIETALGYARRSVELAPQNAECVLSLAVCHGKLALFAGTREKVELSRLVRQDAERALALDPNYAWAHHLLGRWHYEVADLGATARFFVRLFYGGLPEASTRAAVDHLERAVALEPGQLQHRLELGFALLADGRPDEAQTAFQAGLALPSREKHDEPAKVRARVAVVKIGK